MVPKNFNRNSEGDYPYYRGMRLNFTSSGNVYWRTPKSQNIHIEVTSGLKSTVKSLLKLRPEGGSFRITEAREVLLKQTRMVMGSDGKQYSQWFGKFICLLDEDLEFENKGGGVEHNPSDLNAGDLWTGIYDGTRLSFVRGIGGSKIWWTSSDESLSSLRYKLNNPNLPAELEKELNYWKPLGGRFCVTIDGHVITLIDPKQRNSRHKGQFESMTDAQQQLVEVKEESTKMFATYIGKWDMESMLELKQPRRYGDVIPQNRKDEILSLLSNFSPNDYSISSSMVPQDAEPVVPEIDDYEVLEEIERQILEEE